MNFDSSMAICSNKSFEAISPQLRVGNLPFGVTRRQIGEFFEQFGIVTRVNTKHRVSKDSLQFLPHPIAFIAFKESDTVDRVMSARPLKMDKCELFVRRCLPITKEYPNEAFHSVQKMLICVLSEHNNDEILPDDKSILKYFALAGGKIKQYERLNDRCALVEFDDYDPVDVCCLLRPHYIKCRKVHVEKFIDEKQLLSRDNMQQKSHSDPAEISSNEVVPNMDGSTMNATSLMQIVSNDEQIVQLRLQYDGLIDSLERQHERTVTLLSNEWEGIAKERIRLQRLTLDYQQESDRMQEENRQWRKLFRDSLRENLDVQSDSKRNLRETHGSTN